MDLKTFLPAIIKVVKFYLPTVAAYFAVAIAVLVLIRIFGLLNPGNLPKKSEKKSSPLNGKNIIFLGSSVTRGMASYRKSFVDMISDTYGVNVVKEAVSGTTLVETGKKNYIARLKAIDKNAPCDVFVCQLSTNDATKKKPLGTVSDAKDIGTFDTKTICGAIEYIIAYAKETWNCPVVFYTNPAYASPSYLEMVHALHSIAQKWDIEVIDFWNDAEINSKKTADGKRKFFCMNDQIHPTKKGYATWTPIIAQALENVVKGNPVPSRAVSTPALTKKAVCKKRNIKLVKKLLIGIVCVIFIVAMMGLSIFKMFVDGVVYGDGGDQTPYTPEKQTMLEASPLKGKTFISVGSSVSAGYTGGVSFEDYLEVIDGATVHSLSQSATTIAIREGLDTSYVERLQRDSSLDWEIDGAIIQLSTNDASLHSGVTVLTDSLDSNSFDLHTASGGLEFLISYIHTNWGCPIFIYTCAPFENGPLYDADAYGELVKTAHAIAEKWNNAGINVYVIDQWNDPAMQNITKDQLYHYMLDPVHPTMAGYLKWWLPNFQEAMYPYYE